MCVSYSFECCQTRLTFIRTDRQMGHHHAPERLSLAKKYAKRSFGVPGSLASMVVENLVSNIPNMLPLARTYWIWKRAVYKAKAIFGHGLSGCYSSPIELFCMCVCVRVLNRKDPSNHPSRHFVQISEMIQISPMVSRTDFNDKDQRFSPFSIFTLILLLSITLNLCGVICLQSINNSPGRHTQTDTYCKVPCYPYSTDRYVH